ncbi:MAG: enoyl-CoA hydratase/isomerase family protein [Chitinophagales bacterium]|nr:enoyl-CoA hydratase/isomerase family protein [Bacteroidota bacterium]MCB9042266.1 enoyl-CoA hydratase/isomerase family protein [Chitinophagales bacterium]
MSTAYVNYTLEKHIARITFFHPQSNSLPGHLLQQLADTITDLGNHSEVRVIILQSAGERAFCAGASFDELVSIKNETEGLNFFSGFAKVINAMRTCPKFIIGRVHGKAVGGGVGIAAAVDYCFAHQNAAIKLSELAVGIGPFVVGPAVQRKVGLSAFSQLAINATQWQSASWAQQKGLYAEVFDTTEALDENINTLAQTLADSNPEAMKALKSIFWENTDHWNELLAARAATSGTLVLSDFTRNAIAAFKKA